MPGRRVSRPRAAGGTRSAGGVANVSPRPRREVWVSRTAFVADVVTIVGFALLGPSLLVALIGANVIRNPLDPSFEVTFEDTLSVELPCITQETVKLSIDELSRPAGGVYTSLVSASRALARQLGSPAADVPRSSFAVLTLLQSKPTDRASLRLPEPGTFHYLITGQARLSTGQLIYERGEAFDWSINSAINAVYFVDSEYRCTQTPNSGVLYPIALKTPGAEKTPATPNPAAAS